MSSTASDTPTTSETPRPNGTRTLYADAGEGLKAVRDDFHYWTGKLTENSAQLSFAVLAANWAVFGSVQGILSRPWARGSVFTVVASLTLNLLGAKWMGELHGKRAEYAEQDSMRWEAEWKASLGRRDPWPFTQHIEWWGRAMREIKTWLPLAAGALFLVGILVG